MHIELCPKFARTSALIVTLFAALLMYCGAACAEDGKSVADAERVLRVSKDRYSGTQAFARITVGEKQMRTEAFYEYLDSRDAYYGIGITLEARRAYLRAAIEDARLRQKSMIGSLQPLLKPSRKLSESDALRYELTRAELAHAREWELFHDRLLERLPNRSGWKRRIICLTNEFGLMSCVRERTLYETFVLGYWEKGKWIQARFDEARAYAVARKLDELLAKLKLDPTKNTLLRCGKGQWLSLDTQGANDIASAPTAPDMPSLAEVEVLAAVCQSSSGASGSRSGSSFPGSGGGLGGTDSGWVQRSIDKIDAEMVACTQSGDPRISAGDNSPAEIIKGLLGVSVGIVEALDILMNTPHSDEMTKAAEEREAKELEKSAQEELERIRLEVVGAETEAERLQADAEMARKEAEDAKKKAEDERDLAKKKELEDEAKKKEGEARIKQEQANKAKAEADCRKKSGMSCEDWEKAKKEAAKQPAATAGSQLDGVNYSSCSSRQASWNFFKQLCEISGGWDRPGDRCNELLRRMNGCVSTRLIYPDPEGDKTCQRGVVDKEALQREACKQRQKVISVAEHSGDLSCGFLNRDKVDRNIADVCKNPAARPRDDQSCSQPAGVPGGSRLGGGTPPAPYSNAWYMNGVQIYDMLRLDGAGLSGIAAQ